MIFKIKMNKFGKTMILLYYITLLKCKLLYRYIYIYIYIFKYMIIFNFIYYIG